MFLRLTAAIMRLTLEVIRLTSEVIKLRKVIGLRMPGLVFLKRVSIGVNGMGMYALVLPTPGADDVASGGSRELVVIVGTGEPVTQALIGAAMESEQFEANEDDILSGSLVDIDDDGNRSEPRLYEIKVPDTTAPPMPGEIGLRKIVPA